MKIMDKIPTCDEALEILEDTPYMGWKNDPKYGDHRKRIIAFIEQARKDKEQLARLAKIESDRDDNLSEK